MRAKADSALTTGSLPSDEEPREAVCYNKLTGLIIALPWRHLLLFSGLRSALKEDVQVSNKTKRALEHAYVRGLVEAMDTVTMDISEGTICQRVLLTGSDFVHAGFDGTYEPVNH